MDDSISRQAAISEIVGMTTMGVEELVTAGDKEKFDWIKGLSDSLVKIINLPSAQPEIVMCKDCKHGMYDMMCKFYWCHGVAHSANWFCADGKRRTDE